MNVGVKNGLSEAGLGCFILQNFLKFKAAFQIGLPSTKIMITTKFQIFTELFDHPSREKIAKLAFFFLFSPALEMLYLEFFSGLSYLSSSIYN
jgi:hypothetical protein